MKIVVDREMCEKHGQCVISAPNVFRWDADGELAWQEQVDPADADESVDAADVCPVQAIRLEDLS